MSTSIPRIFAVMIVGPEQGTTALCDGLEHEGKLWLVPQWLDVPGQGLTKPVRLIRFDQLEHTHSPGAKDGIEYVVNVPIPKTLFDIRTPKITEPGFEVVDLPELALPRSGSRLQ